jgi:eukaryotic-like serine/threonine-protein kinase
MPQAVSIVGQVLSHYRVLEQIGAGGMGMVFRASDQQLERDVAIKVLPPGMLADESARKRFRREALALAKMNHPNIGTVYEFGTQGELDFLVMEFVSGVSVDAKLAAGPLPQKDVLRLGFQLADGLTSAHEHGVIHRDLKPANLRLTQDNRLKILDFGLAQLVRPDIDLGVTASIAEGKKVVGTLPYMSPEQLRGESIDQRSDIWAAGAVLYELATGRRPFSSSQVPVLIDSILNKAPGAPSGLNSKISPGLDMAILKCLDKDPERRYQSAKELRVDLERLTMPISGVTAPRVPVARKLNLRILLASATLLLLVAGAFYLYLHLREGLTREVTKARSRRRTVAVLSLKNSSARPEAAWLSTALAEMLTTELGVGEKLRTITGEQIAQMKLNLALGDLDGLSEQALRKAGDTLGADFVILGSYVALADGKLRVDLHVEHVAGGDTLMSIMQTGDENDLFDLISRAGAQLREKFDVRPLNSQDQAAVRAALPPTPEASKLYAEGLAKLRLHDAIEARNLLQQAVAADPNHALARSALAAAWSLLGYDENARLSAKSAYDLSASLSREERLLIEARYRETSKEWDNAAETYRTLFGFFSDNLEYGLLLAQAQYRGGKGKEAQSTIESLRRLPPPDGNDPRIDLAASQAWRFLGDFKQSADFADAAAQKARASGAKLILARALYQQGFARENLGDTNGAVAYTVEAGQIYESVGDRFGMASTLEVAGQVLLDHGDLPAALAKFKDELQVVRDIGARRAEASAMNNMGLVLKQQGDAKEALAMFQQELPIFREVSDKDNYVQGVVNIASVMQDDGDLTGAKKNFEEALSLSTEIGDGGSIATSLTGMATVLDQLGDSFGAKKLLERAIQLDLDGGQSNPSADKLIDLGDVLQHLGDLPTARKNYERALTLSRSGGDSSNAAYALAGLGSLEMQAANLPQARKDYEEALKLRQGLGEKDTIASTRLSLAELDIEEGHADTAGDALRQLRDEFSNARKNDQQVTATALLGNALLSGGKTNDANKELEKTANLAIRSQNLGVQLTYAVAEARADAASHKNAATTRILKDALNKAIKAGYLGFQLEIRLVQEEIASKLENSPASHSRIGQLQKEANEKGFELISRKAAAL